MGNRNLSVSTVRKSLSKNDVKGRRPEKKTLQKKQWYVWRGETPHPKCAAWWRHYHGLGLHCQLKAFMPTKHL